MENNFYLSLLLRVVINNDRTNKNKKWKDKLISSSLPLEFEAAKILVSKKFSITSDYSYARDDSGVIKNFSVDILARIYTPFSNPNKVTASLELLVECKQKNQKQNGFFFQKLMIRTSHL